MNCGASAGLGRSRAIFAAGAVINLAVFFLPHLIGLGANHGDYTPFSAAPELSGRISVEETYYYATGPSRFYHAGRVPAELDVYELRDMPNPHPVLHSVVIGLLAKLAGSLERAWMFGHAVFPTLIWMILCWNAYRFGASLVLAMAAAWLTCLVGFGPRSFLLIGAVNYLQPLALSRMPQPALSFLFLILAIWLVSRAMERPSAGSIIASAVSAGALFYAYYFYWIAFFAGAGVLLVILTLQGQWKPVKTLASVIAIGSTAGIPSFIWSFETMRFGRQAIEFGQQDLIGRRVEQFTRKPDVAGLAIMLLSLVLLWLYSKSDEKLSFPLAVLAVVAGAGMGLNFHVLTGFNAEHEHFYNRVLEPLSTYLIALLAIRFRPSLAPRLDRPIAAAGTACVMALVALAGFRQIVAGRNLAGYHRASSPNMDVLVWLRARIEPDAVVGATDGELVSLIPTITGAWTFVPGSGRSIAPTQEILIRYLMLSRLEGKNWDVLQGSALGMEPSDARSDTLKWMTARKIWTSLDLSHEFASRKLDYLVSRRGLPAPSASEVIYRNAEWRVMRVKVK